MADTEGQHDLGEAREQRQHDPTIRFTHFGVALPSNVDAGPFLG
jgi:hypothetical protein